MTVRDLFREFVAAKRSVEQSRRVWISQAWLTAKLSRVKDFPDLNTLLMPVQHPSHAQQRFMLEMMSAKLGVPLKRVRLIRREVHG